MVCFVMGSTMLQFVIKVVTSSSLPSSSAENRKLLFTIAVERKTLNNILQIFQKQFQRWKIAYPAIILNLGYFIKLIGKLHIPRSAQSTAPQSVPTATIILLRIICYFLGCSKEFKINLLCCADLMRWLFQISSSWDDR